MTFKINSNHWSVILEFMEGHKQFARGQFIGPTGRSTQRRLWEELSGKLNAIGLGTRTVEKWQKTWADIKHAIKKKASANKMELAATCGGPKVCKPLNEYEERVLSILGKTFHEGVGSTECGVPEELADLGMSVTEDFAFQEDSEVVFEEVGRSEVHHTKPQEGLTKDLDHDYIETPNLKKRKSQAELENLLYEDTIKELKSLKLAVINLNTSLLEINKTLQEIKISCLK